MKFLHVIICIAIQQMNDYYSSYSFPDVNSLFEPNFTYTEPEPTPTPSPPVVLGDVTNKIDKPGKMRRQKMTHSDNDDQSVFVMKVKRHRIRLGFTQADVGISLGALYDRNFSQTTVCR